MSGSKLEKIKKDIQKLFKEKQLDIVVQCNMKTVNYLDVTLNLENSTYHPYQKKKNHIKYINIESFYKSVNKSGYKHKLEYKANTDPVSNKKQRQRNIIWINPPSNKNVKTNIGKVLLNLIKKHILPHQEFHKLSKKNAVKISYSCTRNIKPS